MKKKTKGAAKRSSKSNGTPAPKPKGKRVKVLVKKNGDLYFHLKNGMLADALIPKPGRLKRNRKEGEVRTQGMFGEAAKYAVEQLEDPAIKAMYARGITENKRTAYNVALTDYMTPPKIIYINTDRYSGHPRDVIVVKATDDFKVESVHIQIFVKGNYVEGGDASPYPRKPKLWRYFATVENPHRSETVICATAHDRPMNTATMTISMNDR